jgi:hypothetical protein
MAVMVVSLQLTTAALAVLSATMLAPCVAPKFVPVIVTDMPAAPTIGERLVILRVGVTVNPTGLLAPPPTVTITLPVVAPGGTCTVIVVALQLVGLAVVPANVTVLAPCVGPKLVPVIVTGVPTAPEFGFRFVMLGIGSTVKLAPLLATPPTVTITFPFVAAAGTGTTMLASFQLVGVAAAPLNATVLVPCVDWKPAPWIVMVDPIVPAVGDKNWIVGALLVVV